MAITDNFNRASLGANWSAGTGTIWTIPSSVAARPVDQYAYSSIFRSEASFPDNQYAQAVVQWVNAGDLGSGGVGVRMSATDGIFAFINATDIILAKRVSSVNTYNLTTASLTTADGSPRTLKIVVTGTSVDVYADTVLLISAFTVAGIASGAPGLIAVTGPSTAGLPVADDFESTDASGSTPTFFGATPSCMVGLRYV